jgi:hypothetical protein
MHRFEQGNTLSKGRPRGSRKKLAKRFFDDMSEVWSELTPDGKSTKGKAALRLMWRERPGEFAKLYAAVMPREFWVDSAVTELDDGELDALIAQMRQRLLTAREEKSLDQAAQMKLIGHAH